MSHILDLSDCSLGLDCRLRKFCKNMFSCIPLGGTYVRCPIIGDAFTHLIQEVTIDPSVEHIFTLHLINNLWCDSLRPQEYCFSKIFLSVVLALIGDPCLNHLFHWELQNADFSHSTFTSVFISSFLLSFFFSFAEYFGRYFE